MKNIVIIFILVILVSCSNEKDADALDTSVIPSSKLQSEKMLLDEPPLLPKGCCLRDSFLIVFEPKLKDGFLSFYSLSNGKLIKRYGRIGQGKGDFQNPRFIFNEYVLQSSSELLIGDYNKLCYLNIDSVVYSSSRYDSEKKIDLLNNFLSYNYVLELSDSLFIFNMTNQGQLLYHDRYSEENTWKSYYEKLSPLKGATDFCYTSQIYDAYYTANKDVIVIAYKNIKQIDVVTKKSGKLKKRILMDDYLHNVDKMQLTNKANINLESNALLYFTYAFPLKNFFYVLCWNDTKENIKKGVAKSMIYKFDWSGNLHHIYNLDRPVSYFCINDEMNIIYAIGSSESLEIEMFYYKIN